MHRLDERLSFEEGTFHPLSTSSAGWTRAAGITAEDRVVVLGQGIVGNLVMQFARRYRPAQLIAVDALDLRCRLAAEVGAPAVVHAGEQDPVEAVRRLTGGDGATIVIDCVGGQAGVQSFAQAQHMLTPGGLLQLIGAYHGKPLPLDASKIMGKRLLGGYPPETDRAEMGREAMMALAAGEVRVQPLITHRFAGQDAKQAFGLPVRAPGASDGSVVPVGLTGTTVPASGPLLGSGVRSQYSRRYVQRMRPAATITVIRPIVCATGHGRTFLFVLVDTDAGLTGVGEGSQSDQDAAVVANVRQLAPRYVGRNPLDVIEARGRLLTNDRTGRAVFVAVSAIEQALWDLAGKLLDVPGLSAARRLLPRPAALLRDDGRRGHRPQPGGPSPRGGSLHGGRLYRGQSGAFRRSDP